MDSLTAGLDQSVSLIQGPPGRLSYHSLDQFGLMISTGTGKLFIGALIAKALYEHTQETVLVLSYTNHALDQSLGDLLDNGIPPDIVVRLGSKSATRTAPLSLFKRQEINGHNRSRTRWEVINNLENQVAKCHSNLVAGHKSLAETKVSWRDILDYLEFSEEFDHFHPALLLPENDDGMSLVGKDGKNVKPSYLYDRWSRGEDSGIFPNHAREHHQIWDMNTNSRMKQIKQWTTTLLTEKVSRFVTLLSYYNDSQQCLARILGERNVQILKSMRVIGCTTTAAAKYAADLRDAAPGVVPVEEAGEILESHILTALSPTTKQLILIGDHKQLRPKYSNYAISVEKGDGYDLNRSMFERLVLANYPRTTLSKQHRMCPEISSLIKHLTYPNLQDATKTLKRTMVRGIQDRVVFSNHSYPEVETHELTDRRDPDSKTSKSNKFETDLVLKCIRYLGQQGYGTDKLVILTPYLGQLRLLRDRLMTENDPVLNDLDSYDLVRAGLLSEASAKISGRPIKISTIGRSLSLMLKALC